MSTDNLARRLLALKERLESERARRAELVGELKSVMKQLAEAGMENLEQAEQWVQQEERALAKMRADIEVKIAEIERLMKGAM